MMRRQRPAPTPLDPKHPKLSVLSRDLAELTRVTLPEPQHLAEKEAFLGKLQSLVNVFLPDAVVSPFGSVVNGFWTPQSDIDICVQVADCFSRTAQIQVLKKLTTELSRLTSHFVDPRFSAKIPIIHWAPRRKGMLACDISINNTLGIANSHLLGAYAQLDPRFVELGVGLKHWLKTRDINNRSEGTLSSFSMLLMIIHFLQKRQVLPSLQDLAFQHNQAPLYINGQDCRYLNDSKLVGQEMATLRSRQMETDSTGLLLYEFFQYFGHTYQSGVISIREASLFIPRLNESSCYLFIDNPFEIGKDVANIQVSQYTRLKSEFRRAFQLLTEGHSWESICSDN